MINQQNDSQKTQNRRSALNEEQILCNEALESKAFDAISDEAWVELCEKAASKARNTGEASSVPPSQQD